jgi:hypothetical protein
MTIRKTRADVERELRITASHESAHVVFAVLSGRRVKWVTIKPKRVRGLDGNEYISLGRWDIDDPKIHPKYEDLRDIDVELMREHIHTTISGPIVEDMMTGKKEGGEDFAIADNYCKLFNLSLDEMVDETAVLIGERSGEINRLSEMLYQHKTLNEDQIKQAIFQ